MSEKDSATARRWVAEEVVADIKAGKDVIIQDAVIDGPFLLNAVDAGGQVSIERTRFTGPVDVSHTTFKKVLSLKDTTFEAEACFNSITLERDIFLDTATFQGAADFSHVTARGVFWSRSATFEQAVTFTGSHFQRSAVFDRCQFKGDADFHGATRVDGEGIFTRVTFHQRADFSKLDVAGTAFFLLAGFLGAVDFSAARIGGDAEFGGVHCAGIAGFEDVRVEGDVSFWSAVFEDEFVFESAWIGGAAEFPGAQFQGAAGFNAIRIQEHLFCSPASEDDAGNYVFTHTGKSIDLTQDELNAVAEGAKHGAAFTGAVDFVTAQIGGQAVFTNTQFDQGVSFSGTRIDGNAFFNPASFKSTADFSSVGIGGQAEFTNAQFDQDASFNSTRIDGSALFNPATFKGKVDFVGAQLGRQAVFTDAQFDAGASFYSVRIEGSAFFNPGTFKGAAGFSNAHFGSESYFSNTGFGERADFNSADFDDDFYLFGVQFAKDFDLSHVSCSGTIYLDDATTLKGGINLRGSTYYDIDPRDKWRKLLEPLAPYDRQPFAQLEQTFRRAGEDQLADQVYFEGRRRHSASISLRQAPLAWVLDRFLWRVTGYGIQLWRLFLLITVILVLATFAFHTRGAVVTVANSPAAQERVDLSWGDAILFSLKSFLPVKIPAGEGWAAASATIVLGVSSITIATALTITGWILVPVGIAAITGFLKR